MEIRKSKLKSAQNEAEASLKKTNQKIAELGMHTKDLYSALTDIQAAFDVIRDVPNEEKITYENLKSIRLNWKDQAEQIEVKYKKANAAAAGQVVAGMTAGVAVAAMGPTVAMGVATTFGVASTGTAISTLSGVAATNAALAWLGGGALVAGGGGVAGGSALLTLAGPIGWAIAGVTAVASGIVFIKTIDDKKKLENIFTLISCRDKKSYELAIVELNERIKKVSDETQKLNKAIEKIDEFGTNYKKMSKKQKYEIGAYVNLMRSSTMLLINPIKGLQPKFSEADFDKVCSLENETNRKYFHEHKDMVIGMSNLLYKISLDDKDKKVLAASFKSNKKFLESVNMNKKEFGVEDMDMVELALQHRYKFREY